jgi:hypothetical protein
MKKQTITCSCYDHRHYMQIISAPEDKEITININLVTHLSFWQRIKLSLKYIFNIPEYHGHYDTIILQETEIKELKQLLKEYDENNSNR